MYLRPSEICFSQDSIGSTFGCYTSHPYKRIGETLDEILTGRTNVNFIPSISVCKKDGKWFTADNRRLWVFQEAEKRGKCNEIYVQETSYIIYNKFTTVNNGVSVYVRGNPGGYVWRSMPIKRIQPQETPQITPVPVPSTNFYFSSSSSLYQKQNKDVNPSEILSTKNESNVWTTNEWAMSKSKEGLCFEQDIDKYDEEVVQDSGDQKSMDMDSDSDNEDFQQLGCSSDFEIPQQQDLANGNGHTYDSTEEQKIQIEGKVEEKNEDRKETQGIKEVVINVSNIPNGHTNDAFISLDSEKPSQVENRSAVVSMNEGTQPQTHSKITKIISTKRCISICVIIFIAILCLILAIVLGIKLT